MTNTITPVTTRIYDRKYSGWNWKGKFGLLSLIVWCFDLIWLLYILNLCNVRCFLYLIFHTISNIFFFTILHFISHMVFWITFSSCLSSWIKEMKVLIYICIWSEINLYLRLAFGWIEYLILIYSLRNYYFRYSFFNIMKPIINLLLMTFVLILLFFSM